MFEKQARLTALARNDVSYNVWNKSYEEAVKAFEEYANAQPEGIQDILWAYALGGRLMNQRLVNLACEHMDFIQQADKE